MAKNSKVLKFNQHLLLSSKLIIDRDIQESMMRLKLDKEVTQFIKEISLINLLQLFEHDETIFVHCDLNANQLKRRLAYPTCSIFRLEQILGK